MVFRWWLLVREIKGDEEEFEVMFVLVYWYIVLRFEVAFRRSFFVGVFFVEVFRVSFLGFVVCCLFFFLNGCRGVIGLLSRSELLYFFIEKG